MNFKGPSPSCRSKLIYRKLDARGINALLDMHNDLRRKVAKGEQRGQPPAANMRKMVWNTELEEIAQRWADQCTFAHDHVRSKKDGTRVGQNAYTASSRKKNQSYWVQKGMGSVTQAWYNEVENQGFDPSGIKDFR